MHIRSQGITWSQALQVALTGLLAVTLAGFAVGCDSGGANEGDGSDGDGDGSGIEAPAAPSSLEGTSSDGEIGLSWSAVDQADSYNVYRDTQSGVDTSGDPLTSGVGDASYTDSEAQNGTTYYYRVTAVNTEGDEEAESEPSSEVEKTPFSGPPDRPDN